jgi:type VI secretion system secreted protein VgrG
LRSDGHGAVRAKDGLLITAYGRPAAAGHILSMQETTDQLGTAHARHKNMSDLAVHHLAHEDDEAGAVQADLRRQVDDLSGNGHTRDSERFAELRKAHIVVSSPSGIETTTPGSTHSNSGAHHAITAGAHISLASAGSLMASAGGNVGVLANKEMRLIAAKGKVQIQAQADDMEVLAQKVMELIGRQGLTLKSDTSIRLMVGAHAIQMTPGRGIEFLSPLSPRFHTAAVHLGHPMSMTEVIQNSPDSKFNDVLYLADADDRPFARRHYELTRADGSVTKGITDANGGVPIQRNDNPEQLRIRIVGTAQA